MRWFAKTTPIARSSHGSTRQAALRLHGTDFMKFHQFSTTTLASCIPFSLRPFGVRARLSTSRGTIFFHPVATHHVFAFVSHGRPPPTSFWWPSDSTPVNLALLSSVPIERMQAVVYLFLLLPRVPFLDGHRCVHLDLSPLFSLFSVGLLKG